MVVSRRVLARLFGTSSKLRILPQVQALTQDMRAWRHDFHKHPELAFEEVRTASVVENLLKSFGNIQTSRLSKTGVIGVLNGTKEGGISRRIGLRADLDALPMDEANGFEHKSKEIGKFHGCGHDGHTSILLGTASFLSKNRHLFAGSVVFIFQPAEEAIGGGRVMVEDGLFTKYPCDEIYAIHNWPLLEPGTIAVHKGPVMASEDDFEITILGKGGHAAMPHLTVDPIIIGSHVVSAFQSVVSRNMNPNSSVVVSVTTFHSGSAYNIIPGSAVLKGTIRTFCDDIRSETANKIETLATNIAASFGGKAEVEILRGYPATINTETQVLRARQAAAQIVGVENVLTEEKIDPSMASEDFSYMLKKVPGCYMWIGASTPVMVHHPNYDFDDEILPIGAQLFINLVTQSEDPDP